MSGMGGLSSYGLNMNLGANMQSIQALHGSNQIVNNNSGSLVSVVDDKVKIFKKSLYNILFKSYKILIQLVNEYVFKKDFVEKLAMIKRKKDILAMKLEDANNSHSTNSNSSQGGSIAENVEGMEVSGSGIEITKSIDLGNFDIVNAESLEIELLYDKFSEVLRNLQEQLECIDESAYEKIAHMILESVNKIVESLYKYVTDDKIRDFLWYEIENGNLLRIKNSICKVKDKVSVVEKEEEQGKLEPQRFDTDDEKEEESKEKKEIEDSSQRVTAVDEEVEVSKREDRLIEAKMKKREINEERTMSEILDI